MRYKTLTFEFWPIFLDAEVLGKSGMSTLFLVRSFCPDPDLTPNLRYFSPGSTGPSLRHGPYQSNRTNAYLDVAVCLLQIHIFKNPFSKTAVKAAIQRVLCYVPGAGLQAYIPYPDLTPRITQWNWHIICPILFSLTPGHMLNKWRTQNWEAQSTKKIMAFPWNIMQKKNKTRQ